MLGIDISPAMLAQARERADAAGVELELREGDMRDLELDEPAGPDLRAPSARCSTCRPGPTGVASSSASTPRCGRAAASPGTSFVFDPHIAARIDGEWQEQNGIRHRVDQVRHDNRIDITLESGDAISLWWLNRSPNGKA